MKHFLCALLVCGVACAVAVHAAPVPGQAKPLRRLLVSSGHTGNAEIFLVNPDNGDIKNLTNHPSADTEPAWSPDAKKIAFVSDRGGTPNVYVMDADGGNVRQLTKDKAAAVTPRWSPDGNKIAFVSARDGVDNL